ncbi:hypothetical protein BJ138DRAFT_1139589 [Hygrophoropsis aurantiaca]|uniref:Uncharacterized protein n=1 Tax=Hygrophoropsis aurantiaca TaxID=72124 RepID=A0ACB8AT90_9AGAM|nr:hypothetical protein BJ138DRAFT_1139589 [Hygrophoropsis aurantiaca]
MLYFANRYAGDIVATICAILFCGTSFSLTTCRILFQIQAWGPFISVWATQLIMQVRIYAMYQRSKAILAVMAVFFAFEVAAISVVLATHFEESLSYNTEPIPGVHMCATSAIGKAFTAIYIPIFSFELVVFVLGIWVVFKHLSQSPRGPGFRKLHTTMRMLGRYSTVYFFIEALGCAVAVGMYLGLPSVYIEVANAFLVANTIIVGSRFVLNTRNFYSPPSDEDETDILRSISFAERLETTEMSIFKGQETQEGPC